MKEIKAYAVGVGARDLYKQVNELLSENLKNRTVPYFAEEPLPQDMNIVTGTRLGDINKIVLELKAASIGATSLKWIYGADAAMLGLELKDGNAKEYAAAKEKCRGFNTEPVVVYAQVPSNFSPDVKKQMGYSSIVSEGLGMDAQAVYLLDQFTEKSVRRALSPKKIEETIMFKGSDAARKKIKVISQNMIMNMSEYDTGIRHESLRAAMRENCVKNLNQNGPVYAAIVSTKDSIFAGYTNDQKNIFRMLYKYYLQQNTGMKTDMKASPEKIKEFEGKVATGIINLLNSDDPTAAARTFTDALLFSDRTTHIEFEYERVYMEADKERRRKSLVPSRMAFAPSKEEQPSILMDRREQELLRSNSRRVQYNQNQNRSR